MSEPRNKPVPRSVSNAESSSNSCRSADARRQPHEPVEGRAGSVCWQSRQHSAGSGASDPPRTLGDRGEAGLGGLDVRAVSVRDGAPIVWWARHAIAHAVRLWGLPPGGRAGLMGVDDGADRDRGLERGLGVAGRLRPALGANAEVELRGRVGAHRRHPCWDRGPRLQPSCGAVVVVWGQTRGVVRGFCRRAARRRGARTTAYRQDGAHRVCGHEARSAGLSTLALLARVAAAHGTVGHPDWWGRARGASHGRRAAHRRADGKDPPAGPCGH